MQEQERRLKEQEKLLASTRDTIVALSRALREGNERDVSLEKVTTFKVVVELACTEKR